MYSSNGWLAGEVFVGAGANATLFTQPHGPCILNITRYFGVSAFYCYTMYSCVLGVQLFITVLVPVLVHAFGQ